MKFFVDLTLVHLILGNGLFINNNLYISKNSMYFICRVLSNLVLIKQNKQKQNCQN